MFQRLRNKYVFNFSSLAIIQVSNFVLSLAVIPFVIRKVGADGFGVVAVAQVVMFYLGAVTDYGFNRTATRDIAIYRQDPARVSKIFFTVLFTKMITCILSLVIMGILLLTIPIFRDHFILYILAFSFVLGQLALINWFFQGLEKMHFMALAGLFSRLFFAGLVFLFIKEKKDNALYIFFMGAGNIIAGLVSIFVAIRMYKLKFSKPSWTAIRQQLREGWPITVTNLSQTTCQYVGIFILRIFTNDLLVGYYSIAEKIYFGMKLMLDVFYQVVYPRVCQLVGHGKEALLAFFRKMYIPFLLMVTLAAAGVFIFSPSITRFFIGEAYSYSSLLLRVLCIATVIVCLNIPAQLVLLAADHKKSYLKIFTIGTAINIIANGILARYLDARGTVLSVIITELFITAGLYIELYRIYRIPKHAGVK